MSIPIQEENCTFKHWVSLFMRPRDPRKYWNLVYSAADHERDGAHCGSIKAGILRRRMERTFSDGNTSRSDSGDGCEKAVARCSFDLGTGSSRYRMGRHRPQKSRTRNFPRNR